MALLIRGLLAAVVVAACQPGDRPDGAAPAAVMRTDTAAITEAFITAFDTADNVDSPAVYHHGDTHWVFASAKTTDVVIVYDAATGAVVRRLGGSGTAPGQLKRPNGVAVVDSLLFVVERDNRRVQAFRLPGLEPAGIFGTDLRNPYGIAWVRNGPHAWRLWVTDNYETPEETVPPIGELGERVREYAVRLTSSGVEASLARAFGDTTAAGALLIVESIVADSAAQRLLIAEETETDSYIKVYDLDGRFTGQVFGRGLFPQQAEGVVLYDCGGTTGYWVATDQGEQVNTYHVFDRTTFEHRGSFTGQRTRLTDGIALTQVAFGPFPAGALYASHLDGAIAAMSWSDIATALSLRSDCRR